MTNATVVRLADDLRWCPQCRDERTVELVELVELPDAEPETVPVCLDCGCGIG